jgi:hypothetical protein
VPFSPDEMVPPSMNSQSGPLGPDSMDYMTLAHSMAETEAEVL